MFFFKKKLYICNAYHLKQARWLAILCCGHFYALWFTISYKFRPVWSVNAPTACFRW